MGQWAAEQGGHSTCGGSSGKLCTRHVRVLRIVMQVCSAIIQPRCKLAPCAYLASVARHAVWLHLRQPIPNSCLQGSEQRPSVTPVGVEREPLQTRHLVPVASHWAPEGKGAGQTRSGWVLERLVETEGGALGSSWRWLNDML